MTMPKLGLVLITAAVTLGAAVAAGQLSTADRPEPHRCQWVIV